ncbi:DUF4145 domain-containing protein [Paenarthrobacter sp. YIM B13468]|uniref:DUF4145 domain-containing protein n=1 Tax=Paenarthrobacter sp. YIM B13468 TaxID=3366295 RepID=UPI00366E2B93
MNFWSKNPPTHWSPPYLKGQDYQDVPESVAIPASEAHRRRSIDALMSTILMARSVIESVAKDNGIENGNLYQKIDKLHETGLIDEFTKETAHTIRVFGNDMAHGDLSETSRLSGRGQHPRIHGLDPPWCIPVARRTSEAAGGCRLSNSGPKREGYSASVTGYDRAETKGT